MTEILFRLMNARRLNEYYGVERDLRLNSRGTAGHVNEFSGRGLSAAPFLSSPFTTIKTASFGSPLLYQQHESQLAGLTGTLRSNRNQNSGCSKLTDVRYAVFAHLAAGWAR